MTIHDRDHWLEISERELLAGCEVDTYRAGGPGGQKRNKTSSAVRLRHTATDVIVIAEESRSQHENKARALRRLRLAIALKLRAPVAADSSPDALTARYVSSGGRMEISRRNPDFPIFVAHVLDHLKHAEGRLADAAIRFGVSTAQLSKFLTSDEKLLAAANDIRRRFAQRPLTAP